MKLKFEFHLPDIILIECLTLNILLYVSMLYKFYGFLHLEIFDKCINRNWLTIPRSINICCRTHRLTLNSPDDWSEKEGEKEREGNGGSEKSRDSPRGANLPQKITHGKRWTRVFFLATRTVHVRYKKRSSLREAAKETLESAIRLRRSIKGTPGTFDVQQTHPLLLSILLRCLSS